MSKHQTLLDARIIGQRDVELIRQLVGSTPDGTRFIEFGPWLGYLSRIMAEQGPVVAVDNFDWSRDHAKRIPGLHEAGTSFLETFRAINSDAPHPITPVETDFSALDWDGQPFGFCLIDAPKSADKLVPLLKRVLPHLESGATIVIVNGRNPKHFSMVSLIARAAQAGLLRWLDDAQAGKSKAAVLARGDIEDLDAILDGIAGAPEEPQDDADIAELDDALSLVSIMASCVARGQWSDAYQLLARAETMPDFRTHWEEAEATLDLGKLEADKFGHFSHMIDACHSKLVSGRAARQIHKTSTDTIEEFWFRNHDKPWRARAFHPEIISRAQAMGYANWPSEISGRLLGKRVIDVGCGAGLHGIGVLAAGAACYDGVDPTLRTDVDKVKDLVRKKTAQFGFTGAELMDLMPAIGLYDVPIEEFSAADGSYDVALMHMVSQHLPSPKAAFAAVSRLLAPGGTLILRHRNFNSWNGHQIAPNTVDVIDPGNPAHMELVDWRHLDFDPPPEHYIARKLNRLSLSQLRDLLTVFFDIEVWLPKQSTERQGLGRLTDEVRARHPHLNDDDFETQTVFCVARRR